MTSCILLAAGLSSRFGSPKALTKLHNITVIEHIQNTLINSNINEIVVVLGAHQKAINPYIYNHKKIISTFNADYELGQTSSFKTGLSIVSEESKNIFLLPVDYPLIKTETFNQIILSNQKNKSAITIPVFESRRGHPPLFDISLKQNFLNLENTLGINSIFQSYQKSINLHTVNDPGVTQTFNTPEEFRTLTKDLNQPT